MHVWDLASKKELTKLLGHQTKCSCIYGDPMEGRLLVTGSDDTKVKVWDLRTGKCI